MAKNKTNLMERKVPLIVLLFLIVIGAVITFLVGYYYLVPNEIMYSFVFVVGICFIFAHYFWREYLPRFAGNLLFLGSGWYLGFLLNVSLSTEFLSKPSFTFLVVNSFITCILIWASFTLRNDISWLKKLTFIFLGCWIASLFLALSGFVKILVSWLSFLPLERELPSGQMRVKASVIVNILKSLFLSSLFNVLERITRMFGKK